MRRDWDNSGRTFGRIRNIIVFFAVVALVIWAAQALFMAFFAMEEPESVPAPEDVVSDAPAEQRGGVSGGGDDARAPVETIRE